MYAWSFFRALTFWLASTSIAASIASDNVVDFMIINSSIYLDGKELINFLMIILVGVLLCGSTHL